MTIQKKAVFLNSNFPFLNSFFYMENSMARRFSDQKVFEFPFDALEQSVCVGGGMRWFMRRFEENKLSESTLTLVHLFIFK